MSTDECTCPWVDEKHWTRYYGAVEPGSQREYEPSCPEHGQHHIRVICHNPQHSNPAYPCPDCDAVCGLCGEAWKCEGAPLDRAEVAP